MKKYILQNKVLTAAALIFSILFSAGSAAVALILREITDIAVSGDMDAFKTTVLWSIVLFAAIGICYYIYSVASKKLICRVVKTLRQHVMDGILKRNMSDFRQVNSADYLSALTNDIKLMEDNYFTPLFTVLQSGILFVLSLMVMIYLSPVVTICLLAAMILMMTVPALFQKSLQQKQETYSRRLSRLTVKVKDLLSGFEVIRAYGMHKHSSESFSAENVEVVKSKYAVDKFYSFVEALSAILGVVVQVGVLFLAAYLIIKGKLTAGAMLGLVQVSGSIAIPIQTISQNLPKIQGTKEVSARLEELSHYKSMSFIGIQEPKFEKAITAEGLEFAYEEEQAVIDQVDLKLEKNKKYAIVGKSGCGKSTLVNLFTGCYAGYKGTISYDGDDMRELDIDKLSWMTSVIHQNVYMFDTSARENICLQNQYSQEEIENALRDSGADTFISSSSDLEKPVGENGANLSGGQRQRLAVARALIQQKPILILDEGTSAIDKQTAYDIESRLVSRKDLTLLTITHNLDAELLKEYDEIIYMEEGRIAAKGSYEELMENSNEFISFAA